MVDTNGEVELYDFDRGVIETMGGVLRTEQIPNQPGQKREIYCLAWRGVVGTGPEGAVKVLAADPDDPFQRYVTPSMVISRGALQPAFYRNPSFGTQSRMPSVGSKRVTVRQNGKDRIGADHYTTVWQAMPFDIPYQVSLRARTQVDFGRMLRQALRVVEAPSFPIVVHDSLGDQREYDAVGVGFANNSALAAVEDRVIMWDASFTVRAELDTHDPYRCRSVTRVINLDVRSR